MAEAKACGNCGSPNVDVRRQARRGGTVVLVVCVACGARGLSAVGPGAEADAIARWNTLPPAELARAAQTPARAPRPAAVPGADGRDPLELLSRMLVGSSYRVPVEGRGTLPPLSASDIAGAVACMRDELQKEVAVAVATRGDAVAAARVAMRAYRGIANGIRHATPRPLDLGKPADRWRLRLVIFDAARELMEPTARQPYAALAKACRMRRAAYVQAHRIATAALQEALASARRDFAVRVFAR
ncbi:hypothetical protein [[Pseudomonas] boreopolis]|uniref:Uncharacterized protein n=1 Tax=Xanthomonas boreopolis TaxID=86183 RepID=A0A919KHX0_9XANT|nr:hypothetical protein GCM10009090_16430 [[Pseudomonas] boreopolis]